MTGSDQVNLAALRALLLDMVTPDPATVTFGQVRHVLPLADRLAAVLAPHLTEEDRAMISRQVEELQGPG